MKRNLLTIIILALLIVNIVFSIIMLISVVGTNKKTAEMVNNIAMVLNLELDQGTGEEVATEISLADTAIYNIADSMSIALRSDDGKDHYIMFDVAFSMNINAEGYETYGATMSEKEQLIKDAINTTVSAHTITECRENFESIKEEILVSVVNLFDQDFIYKVAISGIKYQ